MRGSQLYWWLKYLAGRTPPFEALVAQPHRPAVCDAVMALKPASVLDYGCGNGANLFLLSQRDPKMELAGMDPVGPAIMVARRAFRTQGAKARFAMGGERRLAAIETGAFDVVLSDAVMFYLDPVAAHHAFADMLRIARKGVILSTWHGPAARDGEAWVHDYRAMAGNAKVTIDLFPAGAWQDARWQRYGAIVTVTP